MTDITGLQEYSIIENNFAPGMTATRCIFIHNSGTLPGRFKIYRGTDSGDTTTLGPTLQVTATLSPNSGACSSLTPPGFANLNRYTVTPVTLTIGMTDQSFKSLSATPVKIPKTAATIQPGQFAVYRLEITLPSTTTAAVSSASYTANLEVFGMQAEGSGTDSDW